MLKTLFTIITLYIVFIGIPSNAQQVQSPSTTQQLATVEAYFIAPIDGQTLKNPITVRFGLKNMGVAPAGVKRKNTGHHHLIIDAELPNLNLPIPSGKNYLHFGGGQTETTLELSPGKHTLQLLIGDFAHISLRPLVASKKIVIFVE